MRSVNFHVGMQRALVPGLLPGLPVARVAVVVVVGVLAGRRKGCSRQKTISTHRPPPNMGRTEKPLNAFIYNHRSFWKTNA